MLSELLLAGSDWSSAALMPYVDERRERLRRLRWTASVRAALAAEFGPAAAARRARVGARIRETPELRLTVAAGLVGPDRVPAWVFEDDTRRRLLA